MEAIVLAAVFLLGGIVTMASLIWQNHRGQAREQARRHRRAPLDLDL